MIFLDANVFVYLNDGQLYCGIRAVNPFKGGVNNDFD